MVPLSPLVSLLLIWEISAFRLTNKQEIKMTYSWRILILEVNIDEIRYVLVNVYNADTEVEQIQVLSELRELMKKTTFSEENSKVLAVDLNILFDSKLETKGGKPSLKQKSVAELLELKEEYDLCDIWRRGNPTKKLYTFKQNHSSSIINRRLDHIFISNKLQEFSDDSDIILAFKTDIPLF